MSNSKLNKLIVFQLAHEEYGIEIQYINSIQKIFETTSIPHSPPYIKGIANYRDNIITIIDLRVFLNKKEVEVKDTDDTRVIISTCGDIEIGLVVDSVREVLDFSEEDIERYNNNYSEKKLLIKGLLNLKKRIVICLDLEKQLNYFTNHQ